GRGGRLAYGRGARPRRPLDRCLELVTARIARREHDLVPLAGKRGPQCAADIAGPDNGDLHGVWTPLRGSSGARGCSPGAALAARSPGGSRAGRHRDLKIAVPAWPRPDSAVLSLVSGTG